MKVTRLENVNYNVRTWTDDEDPSRVLRRELVLNIDVAVPLPAVGPDGKQLASLATVEQIIVELLPNDRTGRMDWDDMATLLRGEELPPEVHVAPAALLDHLGRNGQPR